MVSPFPQTRSPVRPQRASVTRFAPAPTGWLHLGHVLNACYVWNTARELRASVILRVEDHDRERCRPEYEAGILDDLDWLGFVPDVHPTASYRAGPCSGRQSERSAVYAEALQLLLEDNLVYACDCSRRLLSKREPDRAGMERPYPGTCRDKRLPLTGGYGWRVRIDEAVEHFDDALLGPQTQQPSAQCGDMLIRDRLGNWTYQFAVTIDDYWQGVDLVIRGVDLLESTGRQIHLGRLLGRDVPPAYMHHPLIMKSTQSTQATQSPDQKLSKSDRDTGIRDLRALGWTREDIFAEVDRRHR